ncbi:HEPN domain-containing protein [Niabella sp. CC-SYL272]|uniref:HEPN domain-containing protein n=1 Tax=Niabella agricola TaxID=2891571 RepID=UPI001F3BD15E|nr:HEPN domain-containing protein [Niabella agricola]MCF3111364.1 HEPN domain-containing protein [Niabella agricola]
MKNESIPDAGLLHNSAACLPPWDDATKCNLLKQLIVKEAERGFAHYLYELIPDVEQLFDMKRSASPVEVPAPSEPSKEQVIAWITGLCAPEFIFEMEHHTERRSLDLFIVLQPQEARNFKDLHAYIHTASLGSWNIRFTLCQRSQFLQQRKQGNLFCVLSCNDERLVYARGGVVLEPIDSRIVHQWLEKSRQTLETGLARGRRIFEHALLFEEEGAKGLACFMLHQAAELSLRGFAAAFSGVYLRQHSIRELLYHCSRIHRRFASFFKTAAEFEMLTLLETSYTAARYQNEFTIADPFLEILKEKVASILACTDEIAARHINRYVSLIDATR